jgi:hypothetical protein
MASLFTVSSNFISALLCFLLVGGCATQKPQPKIYLWAWERSEDLSFIDTGRFGIVYLAGTMEIDNTLTFWTPRRQRLDIPPGTDVRPVVRIEIRNDASLDSLDLTTIGLRIKRVAAKARAVQLDLDATLSQRAWYGKLVREVRRLLGDSAHISMTALASWTISDPWMDSLPIDEAVPMLFDMGVDEDNVIRYLRNGGEIKSIKARNTFGLALDEQMPIDPVGSRLYLFSPREWKKTDLDNFLKHYGLDK